MIAGIRTGALPQVGGIAGAVVGLLVMLNLAPWLIDLTGDLEPCCRARRRDRGDPRRGASLGRGHRLGDRPRGRGAARDRRAVGDGPGGRRGAGRRAGAADRLARRRAPRGRVPFPRLAQAASRRPPCGRSTRTCRRPPRSSARSRPRSTTPGSRTCSSASSPSRSSRSTRRPTPRRARIAGGGRALRGPGHDPRLRLAGQRDGVPRRARLPRHQRPRRRGRDRRSGWPPATASPTRSSCCSTPTLDIAVLRARRPGPGPATSPTARPTAARRARRWATRAAGRWSSCPPASPAPTRRPAATSTTRTA